MNLPTTSSFKGYVSKYDITNLGEGYLVKGSKDVRINTNGRVGIRRGYTLDGQTSSSVNGIRSCFDFEMKNNNIKAVRSGDGKLQMRYVASAGDIYLTNTFTAGQVYWLDVITGLTAGTTDFFNYTTYWDQTNLQRSMLCVNGTSQIYQWSGAVSTATAYTATTITLNVTSGNPTQQNFFSTGTVLINGTTYTYTGLNATQLTGVTPSPVAEAVQSVVLQAPKIALNSTFTVSSGFPISTFTNDLISTLNSQVYLGSNDHTSVLVSKVDSFTDYSFTVAGRLPGEGEILKLDSFARALIVQEEEMYISAGRSFWYKVLKTPSSDLVKESLAPKRLKTSVNQGAKHQTAVFNIKNSVLFLNNETSLDELGRVPNIFSAPNAVNYSDPIKDDFDSYDFTDASGVYFKYNLYIAVPKENKVLIYNLANNWWEAPQTLPISCFSVIGGDLFGHDYNTPRSYKMFTGKKDNEQKIVPVVNFSYQNYKSRTNLKRFTEMFAEGYISSNTVLNVTANCDIDGFKQSITKTIVGSVKPFVGINGGNASLGQNQLGEAPLGGGDTVVSSLPPKFRKFMTFPPIDFFELQFSFSSTSDDADWEILAFAGNIDMSDDVPNYLTE